MKKFITILTLIILLIIVFVLIRTGKKASTKDFQINYEVVSEDNMANADTYWNSLTNKIDYPKSLELLQSYDLMNYREKNASIILYEYLLSEIKKESYEVQKYVIEDHQFSPESINAFEFDLNSDGKNEIIGIVPGSSYFGGVVGTTLYILQKNNSEYKNISPVIYNYNYELHIYKNKYNGYYSFGIKPTEQIEQEEIRRLKRYGEYRPWLGILFQYNKEISKYDFYYYKAADI